MTKLFTSSIDKWHLKMFYIEYYIGNNTVLPSSVQCISFTLWTFQLYFTDFSTCGITVSNFVAECNITLSNVNYKLPAFLHQLSLVSIYQIIKKSIFYSSFLDIRAENWTELSLTLTHTLLLTAASRRSWSGVAFTFARRTVLGL